MKNLFKTLIATFMLSVGIINVSAASETENFTPALDNPREFDSAHLVLRADINRYFYITKDDGSFNLIVPICYNNEGGGNIPLGASKIDPHSETYKAVNNIFENLNKISLADQPHLLDQTIPAYYIQYEPQKGSTLKQITVFDKRAPEVVKLYQLLQPQIKHSVLTAESCRQMFRPGISTKL